MEQSAELLIRQMRVRVPLGAPDQGVVESEQVMDHLLEEAELQRIRKRLSKISRAYPRWREESDGESQPQTLIDDLCFTLAVIDRAKRGSI